MISKHVILVVFLFLSLSSFSLAQDNFWVQTNGPVGGNVTSIAFDDSGKLYCGTQGGTLFYYSDNKQLWKPLFLGSTRDNINSIVFDAKKRIYFATSRDIFRAYKEGNTWEKINTGLENLEIRALRILPEGTFFVGTKSGLLKSVNQGENWIKIEQISEPINSIQVHNLSLLVVSTDSFVYYSSDGGQNWNKVKVLENMSINSLAIGDDQHFFAGTKEGDVFRYNISNNGWERIAHFDYAILVLHIDSKGNIYSGLGGPDLSNEGGGIFMIPANHEMPKLLSSKTIRCMTSMNNEIYVGSFEGIYFSSENKENWVPLNAGLIAQRVNDIIIDKQDVLFVGSYNGVFRSDDGGETWMEKNNGLDEFGILDMAINSQGHLFVGTYSSGVFRSTEPGRYPRFPRGPGGWSNLSGGESTS